jgi:hypothetical protein
MGSTAQKKSTKTKAVLALCHPKTHQDCRPKCVAILGPHEIGRTKVVVLESMNGVVGLKERELSALLFDRIDGLAFLAVCGEF